MPCKLRNLGVALAGNAEAVEDRPRGVGTVEGAMRRGGMIRLRPRLPSLPRLRRDKTA
jgi:hypothetical protein